MKAKYIIDAYCTIRIKDQTIPDDILDYMKSSSLKMLAIENYLTSDKGMQDDLITVFNNIQNIIADAY
jgi:hypothetical protein